MTQDISSSAISTAEQPASDTSSEVAQQVTNCGFSPAQFDAPSSINSTRGTYIPSTSADGDRPPSPQGEDVGECLRLLVSIRWPPLLAPDYRLVLRRERVEADMAQIVLSFA